MTEETAHVTVDFVLLPLIVIDEPKQCQIWVASVRALRTGSNRTDSSRAVILVQINTTSIAQAPLPTIPV